MFDSPSPAHAAPRRARRLRRTTVLASITAPVVLVAVTTAPYVLADTAPQKVLQAVEITLGPDGGIDTMQATSVRTSKDGSRTETRQLDPSAHVADLPVRVTTSWVHDGRVGTDLSDLEGVDGLVEIDVTVQNTTVRPERFQYDAAGVPRDVYELVATPLTVVASTTLPEGSLERVRRPQPGTTEPGTTNGVVGTGEDGDTTVQWAALLAPPRLSASTTFTLVQDAEDFRLPELTLTVQPGLATDTSVTRLLSEAFDGSGALVGGENNTIGLIADINATLAQATDSLQSVRETLSVSAGQVGAAATASLTSTADSLDASSAAVLADLQSLNTSVAGTVGQTGAQAVTSLQTSVQGVLDYFGTPTQTTPAPREADCRDEVALGEPASTLLGQLSQVSSQLRALSTASGSCLADLRGSLKQTIGDPATCAALPPARHQKGKDKANSPRAGQPLVCQLGGTSRDLVELAVDLHTESARILGTLDAAAVDTVGVRIAELVTAVQSAQSAARTLDPDAEGSSLQALISTLDALAADLTTAIEQTGAASTDGVAAELQELNAAATARLAALEGEGSVQAQLLELASSICALAEAAKPKPEPKPEPEPDDGATGGDETGGTDDGATGGDDTGGTDDGATGGDDTGGTDDGATGDDETGTSTGSDGTTTGTTEEVVEGGTDALEPVDPVGPVDEVVDLTADFDRLSQLVNGTGCQPGNGNQPDPLPDFPTPLTDRISADIAGWKVVQASTDAANADGAAGALAQLESQLRTAASSVASLRTQVTAAIGLVTGDVVPPVVPVPDEDTDEGDDTGTDETGAGDDTGNNGSGGGNAGGNDNGNNGGGSTPAPVNRKALRDAVDELAGTLQALYVSRPGTVDCGKDADTPAAPLNRLAASFAAVDCNQESVASQLEALLSTAGDDVQLAATEGVADLADEVVAVRTTGDAALEALATSLAGQLETAAVAQQTQGLAVVEQQKARLDAVHAAAERELDAAAQDAIGRLAEQVERSNSQQSAAAAALQGQLQKVLLDLGSAGQGRGLLGVIQNSAGQTGVRTAQVEDVSAAAASFRGVRLAELADAQLEQQQLARSLQSAQLFPSFAEDLPAGSTSSTVFVVRLGKGA